MLSTSPLLRTYLKISNETFILHTCSLNVFFCHYFETLEKVKRERYKLPRTVKISTVNYKLSRIKGSYVSPQRQDKDRLSLFKYRDVL